MEYAAQQNIPRKQTYTPKAPADRPLFNYSRLSHKSTTCHHQSIKTLHSSGMLCPTGGVNFVVRITEVAYLSAFEPAS